MVVCDRLVVYVQGVLTGLLENGMSDVEWPLRLPLDPGMEVSGLNYEVNII